MLSSEVIEISDDSDQEQLAGNPGYTSDDSDIIVISVSSPPPEPPASSQPRSSQRGMSSTYDSSDFEDRRDKSDVEFMDADALIYASQTRTVSTSGSQRTGVASGLGTPYRNSASTSPGSRKRKSLALSIDSDDSDDGLVIELSKKSTKKRKTSDEEKARKKAEKEAQKLEKKEEAKRKKEEAAARKAEEKLANKALKDANKLVIDKKKTLKDMTVEISPELVSTPLYTALKVKMDEFESKVQHMSEPIVRNSVTNYPTDLNALGIKIVRWKRYISATYDELLRKWIPLSEDEHFTRTEGTYLIYMTGDDVLRSLGRNPTVPTLRQQVGALREALGPKHHIHLMLCGWKGKSPRKEVKEHVEKELVGLQVREGVFLEQVPDESDAVTWMYNMSADLGIKPHKLIERSHLPFCAQATSTFKVGKSDTDTMIKMLAQLPRLTEPAAKAVMKEYGTFNRLMEAYEQVERGGGGSMMLANVVVPRTASGKDAPRVLNKALSERLHNVVRGSDPKALVN